MLYEFLYVCIKYFLCHNCMLLPNISVATLINDECSMFTIGLARSVYIQKYIPQAVALINYQ